MTSTSFPVMLNGQLVPADQALVSVFDLGFTMGVSLVERLRTYRHQMIFLDDHLDRLEAGWSCLQLENLIDRNRLVEQVHQLVQQNLNGITPENDLSVGIVMTPESGTHQSLRS